jgi:hypothetical protein
MLCFFVFDLDIPCIYCPTAWPCRTYEYIAFLLIFAETKWFQAKAVGYNAVHRFIRVVFFLTGFFLENKSTQFHCKDVCCRALGL